MKLKPMKDILKLKWATIALLFVLAVSCDKDDPEPVNEEELITTVIVTFSPSGGGTNVVASFRDFDGAGGNAPIITNPTLAANTSYTVSVQFQNEASSATEDITEEVEEEAEEHQVFYEVASGLNLTYTYSDQDGNGNPIGLSGTVQTGAASSGSLAVVLVHEPNKTAAGVSGGDATNAGGEEDVRVSFTVTIQ